MSRYRPPQAKSSPYIRPQGRLMLEEEMQALWVRRRDVTKAVTAAAAEGDRSENAEYIYRKKELRGIDRRIRYLQKRLPELIEVPLRDHGDQIFFGATVTLAGEQGERTLTLVGADEIDASGLLISVDSPLAKALLGQSVDAEVTIEVDGQLRHWEVLSVSYQG